MTRERATRLLKLLISLLIFGSLAVGLLAQVLSPALFLGLKQVFHTLYLVFEHSGRALIIVAGAAVILSLLRRSPRSAPLRRRSMIGFTISALVLLCALPVLSGFWEFYYVLMPFPWSTIPLQLLHDGHFLSADLQPAFGGRGVPVLLAVHGEVGVPGGQHRTHPRLGCRPGRSGTECRHSAGAGIGEVPGIGAVSCAPGTCAAFRADLLLLLSGRHGVVVSGQGSRPLHSHGHESLHRLRQMQRGLRHAG